MSDLRSAIEAAVTESENANESVPVVETAAPAVPAMDVSAPSEASSEGTPSADQDTGSPTAGGTEPASSDAAKPAPITEVVGETPTAEVTKEAVNRIDRPPASWKGDAKKLWTQLPLKARQEVLRREGDVFRNLQETAADRQRLSAVEEAIAPHMDRINHVHGGNPIQAISNMLNVERTLTVGSPADKAKLIASMVKHFRVDIEALDSMLAGVEMPPAVQQQTQIEQLLEQKLAPLMNFYQQSQRQQQIQAEKASQEAVMTVEQMAVDPQYPYFDDVREDMADIIEINSRKGVYISIQEAYNKAVRMNEVTYQASTMRDSSQGATQQALAAHQAAQAAKGAAVSVSGAPSGVGSNFGNPADLRGTIESALGSVSGRI